MTLRTSATRTTRAYTCKCISRQRHQKQRLGLCDFNTRTVRNDTAILGNPTKHTATRAQFGGGKLGRVASAGQRDFERDAQRIGETQEHLEQLEKTLQEKREKHAKKKQKSEAKEEAGMKMQQRIGKRLKPDVP